MHAEPGSTLHIALIGATGRVGRALARMLGSADVQFRALVRDPEAARHMLGSHAEVVHADLLEPASVEKALLGSERVLLVCSDPALEPDAIVAARRAGVRRIVKLSAAGHGTDCTPEHQAAERALRESGLAWTILRPTALMQTLGETVRAVTRDGVIRLPAGDAKVAWVDARDVAAVALHALIEESHDGCTSIVTGPAALGITDVAETLSHVVGRSIRYLPIDPARAEEDLHALGVPPRHAHDLAARYALIRAGALDRVTDVVQRTGRVEPRTFAKFAATRDWDLDERPVASAR